ncbi:type II secretion system protein GspL [Permianibacter sp. IMCC34836]|uniref:type II secretion system protein GspL n=1 Tax=Permianibacter fluminis TaxID=2738515 RepID=UPI0015555E26|nr:type II secretion system protein GspL [Permianibacter fluminis]NQD35670.1 type II secretion system protein GspL [Permianibacter fluminis]
MTTALYLRPPAAGESLAEWLELADDGSVLASAQLRWPDDLAQLATQTNGKKLTVLLPVSSALVTRVQVPAKQRKHLAQVLPFLLEDQIAGSIDELHVVAGAALPDDEQQVIAIEHVQLKAVLDTLASHNLHADDVTLDALCLPTAAGETRILLLGQDALLRLPDGSAQLLPAADLDQLLPLLAADSTVQFHCADADFHLQPPHQRHDIDHALAVLARGAQRQTLSLLQGPYAPRTAWQAHWKQWRKVAIVAGIAVLAQYAYAMTDWLLLKQRVSALDGAIRASFSEAFPDQTNTPYPVNSMNGFIKNLGAGGAGGFSALLAEIGPVLQNADGISLRGLGYEAASNELRLDLSARDLSALNALDSQFQQMGFHTDMGQASASSGGYSGRMVLQRGGPQKGNGKKSSASKGDQS